MAPSPKTCTVPRDGKPCGKPVKAKGMCMGHYQAVRRAKARGAAPPLPSPSSEPKAAIANRPRHSKYTDTQIEEALLAVVMNGGSMKRGAELVEIPYDTVRDWMNLYAARYAELRREKGPELERRAVDGLLSFVSAAEDTKRLALEKTTEELEAGETKDPGATLRNVATAQGIAVTKIMELTGRPTANTTGRSAQELLAGLARLGAVINSTAEELPTQPALDSGVQETVAATADSIEGESH